MEQPETSTIAPRKFVSFAENSMSTKTSLEDGGSNGHSQLPSKNIENYNRKESSVEDYISSHNEAQNTFSTSSEEMNEAFQGSLFAASPTWTKTSLMLLEIPQPLSVAEHNALEKCESLFEHIDAYTGCSDSTQSTSDCTAGTSEETCPVIKILQNYRRVFLHLTRYLAEPCSEELRILIKEILSFGKLQAETSARKIGLSDELFNFTKRSKSEKQQYPDLNRESEIDFICCACEHLESGFAQQKEKLREIQDGICSRVLDITTKITRIKVMRKRLLDRYFSFCKTVMTSTTLDLSQVHQYTQVFHYERSTNWHSQADIKQIKDILTKEVAFLKGNSKTLADSMRSMHEEIVYVKTEMSFQKANNIA